MQAISTWNENKKQIVDDLFPHPDTNNKELVEDLENQEANLQSEILHQKSAFQSNNAKMLGLQAKIANMETSFGLTENDTEASITSAIHTLQDKKYTIVGEPSEVMLKDVIDSDSKELKTEFMDLMENDDFVADFTKL